MELKQTRTDLELLEGQREITLEDALNLIYDFFREVKQKTGKTLEKEPAEDVDGLFRRLPWLLRTSVKMVETNQDRIFDPDRKEKLLQRRAELSGMEEKISGQLETVSELAQEEKKLQAKRVELERARQKEAEIQKTCTGLRQEIRALEQSSLPELEEELEKASARKEMLLAKAAAARQDIDQIRWQCGEQEQELDRCRELASQEKHKTEAVRRSVQEVEDQIRAEKERRAGVEARLKNSTEEFEKERESTARRVHEAEERLAAAKSSLEDTRSDLSTLEAQRRIVEETIVKLQEQSGQEEDELEEKTRQKEAEEQREKTLNLRIRELDENIQDLGEQTTALQSRIGTLDEIRSERQKKKDELDAQVSSFSKTCDRLREEVRLLEKDLERRDFTAQERRLRTRKEELQKELQKFEDISRETEKLEQELTRTQQDIHAQENRRVETNQKLVQSETQKNALIETVQNLENRLRTLETWLEGLEAEQYKKRCEDLSARVRTLDGIRRKVEEDWFSDWRRENMDLHDTYEYAADALRKNLSDMENCLRRYIGILKSVIRCMESKSLKS